MIFRILAGQIALTPQGPLSDNTVPPGLVGVDCG